MSNRIKGTTSLIGLLGSPIRHSRSPHMQNSAFKKLGLDYVYLAFNIEDGDIKKGIDAMKTLKVKGFNVTMPHKQKVVELLDEVTQDSRIMGSVNTVLNDNGKLIGYNTDGKAFVKAIEAYNIEYKDKKVVMVGAGGAARAIAIQLAFDGVGEIVIMNRNFNKAQEIIETINSNIPNYKARVVELDELCLKRELIDSSILINCTSLGMGASLDQSIISNSETLHKNLFVADIIYDPLKTKLLTQAEEVGCKIMNGIDMMTYQGALAFKIWTGEDMPIEYIKEVLIS